MKPFNLTTSGGKKKISGNYNTEPPM